MIKRIEPGPGEESVWDYPRPPKLQVSDKHVAVIFDGTTIADTIRAKRILETSHPPVYYIPRGDVDMNFLEQESGGSYCEWKGQANYFSVTSENHSSAKAAWSYSSPNKKYAKIKDHIAFYPHKMDACFVDGEEVRAQEGSFYGGWITDDIVGPFKGGAGTVGW